MSNQADHPYQQWTPETTRNKTRDQLIAWLVWNDPNGSYVDDLSNDPEFPPLTLSEARDLVIRQIEGSK
jgi:hypothetical protein